MSGRRAYLDGCSVIELVVGVVLSIPKQYEITIIPGEDRHAINGESHTVYAGAELAAQIGRIREALRPISLAVEDLGSGEAAEAIIDSHERQVLLEMARNLEDLALTLQDKAAEGPRDGD